MTIANMVGRTFERVVVDKDDDTICFVGKKHSHLFYYEQDCCESVYIAQIDGDIDDLEGSPILMAEEVTQTPDKKDRVTGDDSETWTFYKFATSKGYVTIRWVGSSNGYYSESVDSRILLTKNTIHSKYATGRHNVHRLI